MMYTKRTRSKGEEGKKEIATPDHVKNKSQCAVTVCGDTVLGVIEHSTGTKS